MSKKRTTNEEFKKLTEGLTQSQVVAIFNTPNDVDVKLANVKNWVCVDPSKSQYRRMTPSMLELFKYRLGLIPSAEQK